jgi:Lectin C-type domain
MKILDPLPPTPPSSNGTGSCPAAEGWEEFNGFCYYVSRSTDTTASTNRQTAESLCQVKAGYHHKATLASIHHSSENKFIYGKLKANGKRQAWIGLKKDRLSKIVYRLI